MNFTLIQIRVQTEEGTHAVPFDDGFQQCQQFLQMVDTNTMGNSRKHPPNSLKQKRSAQEKLQKLLFRV